MITIRDAIPGDEAAWRQLWAGYLKFYRSTVPDTVTSHTWTRILDPESSIFCRIALTDDQVAGFAVCVLHAGTWVVDPICYLEDLFVDPERRGGGVGAALIQDLADLCRAKGWARLYWHTDSGNVTARRVYDRFASADDVVRYQPALR